MVADKDDDVAARTSEYQGSDESDDAFSVHSSDWATPPHERAANEAGGFSHLAPLSSPLADSNEDSGDDLPTSARLSSHSSQPRLRDTSPGLFVSENEEDGVLYSVSPSPTREPSHQRSSPGLFVPEDEAKFVVRGETTLSKPENVLHKAQGMEGIKRARDIKNEIKMNIPVLRPQDTATSKHPGPDEDPEDLLVKALRNEKELGWDKIAERLNEERRKRGEAATFTSTTVYSRFVRLSTTTATPIGEVGFHAKDYAHLLKASMAANATPLAKGKKRVKNYDNPKELEVNMRQQVKDKEHEELKTPERSEQLMQAVARVERNFWLLVADEMERSTTRLYSPAALADRYHAI